MARRLLLLAAGAVLLSSCRLELAVDVAVEEDGSGSVEVVVGLDPDGIERIGGDLDAVLAVDDLVAAGWVIDGPALEPDGYTRVRFRRAFANADEAAAIFEDIAGDEGPFQDLAVRHAPSFARTTWDFTGRIDFSGGLEAFGDDALTAALDGEPLGQTVEEIEADLGEPLSEVIEVRVGVRLPGEVTSNAGATGAGGEEWRVGFGEAAVDLEASGEEQRTASLVAAGGAVACIALLLVYGVASWALASRARHRTVEAGGAPEHMR